MSGPPGAKTPSPPLRRAAKPLPPYGRDIVKMLSRRVRPAMFGGAIVVSLDWSLGEEWPRIVLPRDQDPHAFYLDFLTGLHVVIVHRPGHPAHHVIEAQDAIKAVRPGAWKTMVQRR